MRQRWLPVLMGVASLVTLEIGSAQVRTIDPERLLADRFGFTPAEVAQARDGKAVAKLLPNSDSAEVGVVAAVHIPAQADRLALWLKDVATFRKAAELGIARRLSDPPQIGDFADLSLDNDELAALRTCRPGNCDLRLGDNAIQQFQTGVDWAAADNARRANLLTRQLMLGHAQAYLKGGDSALGAYHDEKTPKVAADEFRLILAESKTLHDLAPALVAYLERFPSAELPQSDQLLYWAKGGVGAEASITLHQLVTYHPSGGEIVVADKQLYASRYIDAALAVVSLHPMPGDKGFYAIIGARARSTLLRGVAARVLRGRVEKSTRETTTMYLDWIRASMAGTPLPHPVSAAPENRASLFRGATPNRKPF